MKVYLKYIINDRPTIRNLCEDFNDETHPYYFTFHHSAVNNFFFYYY